MKSSEYYENFYPEYVKVHTLVAETVSHRTATDHWKNLTDKDLWGVLRFIEWANASVKEGLERQESDTDLTAFCILDTFPLSNRLMCTNCGYTIESKLDRYCKRCCARFISRS